MAVSYTHLDVYKRQVQILAFFQGDVSFFPVATTTDTLSVTFNFPFNYQGVNDFDFDFKQDVYKRQRHNFRQLIFTFIDAQTWAADTLNAFYNSFALEILQSKFQFRLGVAFNFKDVYKRQVLETLSQNPALCPLFGTKLYLE